MVCYCDGECFVKVERLGITVHLRGKTWLCVELVVGSMIKVPVTRLSLWWDVEAWTM